MGKFLVPPQGTVKLAPNYTDDLIHTWFWVEVNGLLMRIETQGLGNIAVDVTTLDGDPIGTETTFFTSYDALGLKPMTEDDFQLGTLVIVKGTGLSYFPDGKYPLIAGTVAPVVMCDKQWDESDPYSSCEWTWDELNSIHDHLFVAKDAQPGPIPSNLVEITKEAFVVGAQVTVKPHGPKLSWLTNGKTYTLIKGQTQAVVLPDDKWVENFPNSGQEWTWKELQNASVTDYLLVSTESVCLTAKPNPVVKKVDDNLTDEMIAQAAQEEDKLLFVTVDDCNETYFTCGKAYDVILDSGESPAPAIVDDEGDVWNFGEAAGWEYVLVHAIQLDLAKDCVLLKNLGTLLTEDQVQEGDYLVCGTAPHDWYIPGHLYPVIHTETVGLAIVDEDGDDTGILYITGFDSHANKWTVYRPFTS